MAAPLTSSSSERKSGYLPSLDGWRCLAILAVMWTHDVRRVLFGHETAFYQDAGGFGVQLFFAISGFLIAWRIEEEELKTGFFSLRSFYTRRFFRIQPPQWVYLAVVALLMGLHLVAGEWKYWFGALFLYENYLWHDLPSFGVKHASYLLGHFWTLAVEEHFYLLISLFFFFVKKRRLLLLGGCLALLLLGQELAWTRYFSHDVSDRRTPWVIQYLVFAAWVALALRRPAWMAWVKRYLQPWKLIPITVVLMYAHYLRHGMRPLDPRNLLFQECYVLWYCFTGWVVATVTHPTSWATRVLELRPLRFLGRISYSLYLWHLFFFGGGAPSLCRMPWLTWANQWEVTRIGFSLLFACLSYYLVEKPCIRLGHRLAPPATPGHRDLQATVLPTPAVAGSV